MIIVIHTGDSDDYNDAWSWLRQSFQSVLIYVFTLLLDDFNRVSICIFW